LIGGGNPLGFDTDPFEPDYCVRFPQCVSVVDTSKIQGQVALFDQLLNHNEMTKIIDVGHRFYHDFLNTIDEIGFLDEAAPAMVQPIFIFHSVGTEMSLRESLSLMARWPKLCLIIVFNKGVLASGAPHVPKLPGPKTFIFGALDSVARACFETFDFSVTEFVQTPPLDMSFVTHMALRIWTKAIFDQFRLFEIGMAMQGDGRL
jgi:hypothetical protein